jgi:phosphoribosylaminoimidazole-succinocarboxamide synthase
MAPVLHETRFQFPGQTGFYRGKVRDLYEIGERVVLVASDRISAFDHILPRRIPYKGQVLNQLAAYFLEATADTVPNWLLATPDPNVSIGRRCEPIRLEMVIRGYLTGHAWRVYKQGGRVLCGVPLPEGLKENDPFPEPIITPSTKAEEGHDEDIDEVSILASGIVTPSEWDYLKEATRRLFATGTAMAAERGLILVDTKYEFGRWNGQILVMDEIHTPDSSRYFLSEGYASRQERGEPQQQLSKEFVREWLMAHGFQGLEDQTLPVMSNDVVEQISKRYIALFEQVTGRTFVPDEHPAPEERIEAAVREWLQQ